MGVTFQVGRAERGADGVEYHPVSSDAQAKPTTVRIVRPEEPPEAPRLLLVLPIGQPAETHGDGLAELQRLDVANRYGMVLVAPGLATLRPWYADTPGDEKRRDESFLVDGLLPWLARRFPGSQDRRLLVGMSKSGWGALSLLLRHPHLFAAAACFDAPLAIGELGRYGTAEAFGDAATFAAHDPVRLAAARGRLLGEQPRLGLFGHHLFAKDMIAARDALAAAGVPVHFDNAERLEHRWFGGWLPRAVAWLDEAVPPAPAEPARALEFAGRHPDVAEVIPSVRERRRTFLREDALRDLAEVVLEAERTGLPGQIIEAGAALGGSTAVLARAKHPDRGLLVYDVFAMIPPPGQRDGDEVHARYETIRDGHARGIGGDVYYGYREDLLAEVTALLTELGTPPAEHRISLVPGLFEDTLQGEEPVAIAHIDADWYESVQLCLQRLAPRIVEGGRFVIDDYPAWDGCRLAVDEFLMSPAGASFDVEWRTRPHLVRRRPPG